MNGFWSVIRKEFMHLRRDRATLIIALLLPVIQMTIFGYAINYDVRHIQTVAVDMDNSRESRQYLAELHAGQYLDYVSYVSDSETAMTMLRNGTARVGIMIPRGFARKKLQGLNPHVGVMIDGSDAQVSLRARFAFVAPAMRLPAGTPDARVNILYNPDSKTVNFMIPGLISVILQIVTVALTAFSIVREKEMGTLEQLMVTPVGRLALMLGKLIPYAVLALAELAAVLILSDLLFGVVSNGSMVVLVLMSIPFVFASLALGLLISTVAQTQGQALQLTQLTLMPAILLSGYVSPRETMPGWIYVISSALPATHYMQITRGIMIRGASLSDLMPQLGALTLITAVLVLASTSRFKKSIT